MVAHKAPINATRIYISVFTPQGNRKVLVYKEGQGTARFYEKSDDDGRVVQEYGFVPTLVRIRECMIKYLGMRPQ